MHNRTFLIVVILFSSFLFGCGGSSSLSQRAQIYKKDLRHCERSQFSEVVNQILFMRYQYLDAGNTRDLSTQIEMYTEWKSRTPFLDEKALGIVAVESKITVGAKISAGGSRDLHGGEADFIAYFRAENRVIFKVNQSWQPGPMTKEARMYFGNIAEDMIQEFTDPF